MLLGCAAVTEVSVIGRADPGWGEAVVACVVVVTLLQARKGWMTSVARVWPD